MKTLDERVDAGIEFLAEKHGTDWSTKVDVDRLDMSSTHNDVVAHVQGKPNLMAYEPGSIGLMLERGLMPAANETWEDLNEAWLTRLN
jgi:hypothetical protein